MNVDEGVSTVQGTTRFGRGSGTSPASRERGVVVGGRRGTTASGVDELRQVLTDSGDDSDGGDELESGERVRERELKEGGEERSSADFIGRERWGEKRNVGHDLKAPMMKRGSNGGGETSLITRINGRLTLH
jgi:hypothetical protein